jgi:hypothetical protein
MGYRKEIVSPNTRQFQDYFLSRLLKKFPFLVEAWYWALIYWVRFPQIQVQRHITGWMDNANAPQVYQLGRAFSAVTMLEGTVNIARRHALQVIALEQRLHIFLELDVQHWFLKHPFLMHWTNRVYSFIHIPGTILFLVWLFYYTSNTSTRRTSLPKPNTSSSPERAGSSADAALYAARRRTMATCNLIAFVIFTLWPCMPPRLLSDASVPGPIGKSARSHGFVDTVHGAEGESSVWTQNKFCNQYAAMPSLHFGYSLLIGLTIMSIPLAQKYSRARTLHVSSRLRLRLPSARRMMCIVLGVAYPAIILVAIVATANHFVLDAVAGACVCGLAWTGNRVLLNLEALEDWFLAGLRIHKPERGLEGEVLVERWGREKGGVVVD